MKLYFYLCNMVVEQKTFFTATAPSRFVPIHPTRRIEMKDASNQFHSVWGGFWNLFTTCPQHVQDQLSIRLEIKCRIREVFFKSKSKWKVPNMLLLTLLTVEFVGGIDEATLPVGSMLFGVHHGITTLARAFAGYSSYGHAQSRARHLDNS